MYSSLFPLGVGRELRSGETMPPLLVSHALIPVFRSEPVVLRESPRPQVRCDSMADSTGDAKKSGRKA